MNTELDLELSFWNTTLPHMLCGCAAEDEVDATDIAANAILTWNASADKPLEHSRTTAMLVYAMLYIQLIELARYDKALPDVPAFENDAAKLARIPAVEVSVESKHALAAANLRSHGHNASHASFSVALTGTEITAHREDSLESIVRLAQCVSQVKSLDQFISSWGSIIVRKSSQLETHRAVSSESQCNWLSTMLTLGPSMQGSANYFRIASNMEEAPQAQHGSY